MSEGKPEPVHDKNNNIVSPRRATKKSALLIEQEAFLDPSDLRREVLDHIGKLKSLREHWRDRIRVFINAPRRLSAKDCILAYLKVFLDQNVHSYELLVVSGISEYARRIRELRVEEGYEILAFDLVAGVPRNHYRLASAEPDVSRALAWRLASRIRKRTGSDKERILELLRENVGVPLTHEQLQYVGKGKSTRERLRDLRIEDGWRIATRRTGRPDLRNDQYLLINDAPLPPHDRTIPTELYETVLERDRRRCRKCNWRPEQQVYGGRRHSLEVHHMVHFSSGGTHDIFNLVTLCDLDHDTVHREEIKGEHAVKTWLEIRPAYWVDAE